MSIEIHHSKEQIKKIFVLALYNGAYTQKIKQDAQYRNKKVHV